MLNDLLPALDREVTLRPFDGRWELVVTTYRVTRDRTFRVVERTPDECIKAWRDACPYCVTGDTTHPWTARCAGE